MHRCRPRDWPGWSDHTNTASIGVISRTQYEHGEAVIPAVNGTDAFDYLSREPELAEAFNRAMAETTVMTVAPLMAAYSFEPYPVVVDVGGGVGQLLAAILAATPDQPRDSL